MRDRHTIWCKCWIASPRNQHYPNPKSKRRQVKMNAGVSVLWCQRTLLLLAPKQHLQTAASFTARTRILQEWLPPNIPNRKRLCPQLPLLLHNHNVDSWCPKRPRQNQHQRNNTRTCSCRPRCRNFQPVVVARALSPKLPLILTITMYTGVLRLQLLLHQLLVQLLLECSSRWWRKRPCHRLLRPNEERRQQHPSCNP